MGFQVAEVGMLSLAIMLAMLTGGIDLSIVSIASVAALVAAQLFKAVGAESAVGSLALVETVGFILVGLLGRRHMRRAQWPAHHATPHHPRSWRPWARCSCSTASRSSGPGGQAIYGMPDAFLNIGAGKIAQVPIPVLILLGAALLTAVFVNRTGMGLDPAGRCQRGRCPLLRAEQRSRSHDDLRCERLAGVGGRHRHRGSVRQRQRGITAPPISC